MHRPHSLRKEGLSGNGQFFRRLPSLSVHIHMSFTPLSCSGGLKARGLYKTQIYEMKAALDYGSQ